MRRILLALALGVATTAGAQIPTGPVIPENATPKRSGGEFRVGGFMMNGERSYEFFNNVENEPGSIRGVDVLLRARGIGIGVRSWTAEFGNQPNLASLDARIYLFPPVFSIMVGAGRRATWSSLNEDAPTQTDFALGGVSSTVSIGGTGLRTNVTAAIMVAAPKDQGSSSGPKLDPSTGLEGEASLLYKIPVVPFFISVGYRTEIFMNKNSSFDTPEEARGIRIGGGLQLGGR